MCDMLCLVGPCWKCETALMTKYVSFASEGRRGVSVSGTPADAWTSSACGIRFMVPRVYDESKHPLRLPVPQGAPG